MAVSKPTSGCVVNYKVVQKKGKVVPLQARTGPYSKGNLRTPEFLDTR